MIRSIRSTLAIPAVYKMWTSAVGANKFLKTLLDQYIRPDNDSRILEIGCGPGTLVPSLPQAGYLGFDLSPEYIAEARRRFPGAKFACERVSKFSLGELQSFDLVLAVGIVHHLDDLEARQLFQIAHDALRPGGKLITVDGVLTPTQPTTARWLLKRDRGEHVRTEEAYVALASEVFELVRPSVRGDLLRIPYTHLILECVRPATA